MEERPVVQNVCVRYRNSMHAHIHNIAFPVRGEVVVATGIGESLLPLDHRRCNNYSYLACVAMTTLVEQLATAATAKRERKFAMNVILSSVTMNGVLAFLNCRRLRL